MRFSDEIINALLKIKWWYWDDSRIEKNVSLLLSGNIEEFIEKNSQIE
jgi:hypothetical protein